MLSLPKILFIHSSHALQGHMQLLLHLGNWGDDLDWDDI